MLIHENHGVIAADIEISIKETEAKTVIAPLPNKKELKLIDNSDEEDEEDDGYEMPSNVRDVIEAR